MINTVPQCDEAAGGLVKQLVPGDDIADMRRVRKAIGILLLAGEPWFSPRDIALLAEQDACDTTNIKLGKTGGLNRARDVGTVVSAYSPPCLIEGMLEIGVGTAANVRFAAVSSVSTIYQRDQRSHCLHAH